MASSQDHRSAHPDRLRGAMADAARLPEGLPYYHRLIDFIADRGMNALIFRLCDDQGCSMRFQSHPELVTHPHALSPAEVRELIQHGQKRGIDLIPEIESFGHASFITESPQHAELADTNPEEPEFNGLCPVHPGTFSLITDLYKEVAELFPSRYLHGGCDEVNWGGSARSKEALKTRTRTQIWTDYVNSLNRFARELGREFVIWGDHALRKQPEILPLLDKNIIIHDWDYWTADPAELEKYAQQALKAGLRIIGGPAVTWGKWGPRIGTSQLDNIDAFVEAYGRIDDPRCLGILVTNWVPTRYCQGSNWDGFAYAATAVTEGKQVARQQAFPRFVEQHYGAKWNSLWSDVFRSLYDLAPLMHGCGPRWIVPAMPVPWYDAETFTTMLRAGRVIDPPLNRLRSQLVQCQPTIRAHHEDFEAVLLTVEYIEHIFWRESSVVELARDKGDEESAKRLIETIARRDQQIIDALRRDWNGTRPPHTVMSHLALSNQLLNTLTMAAKFSAQLAAESHRFAAMLKT